MRQFLRLTGGRFGLYSGVYISSGFWLEGARKFGGGGTCCGRNERCLSPLEFVVPACNKSCRLKPPLNLHFPRERWLCSD
jgi:hypothetical protein